jgi:putative transposase
MERRPYYPTDLTDAQWEIIRPLIPPAQHGGRPRSVDVRQILDAILYITRTGCPWRMLPRDLGRRSTVHEYFRRWCRDGTWRRINDALRGMVRVAAGRDESPSLAILDSQSVKTSEEGSERERGYDGNKKVKGRKRHLIVDTLGMLLAIYVSAADVGDRDGAKLVFGELLGRKPSRLVAVVADGGYTGERLASWLRAVFGMELQIVERPAGAEGFVVVPKRWIVERTFGWFNRFRRLAKDYERFPVSSEGFIYISMISIMLHRLASV